MGIIMTPILLSYDDLMQLSQQALNSYWEVHPAILSETQRTQHIATVHTVLYYNFTSGRWKRVMNQDKEQNSDRVTVLRSYAQRVAVGYEEQHSRVHPLERGEQHAWAELRALLKRTAQTALRYGYGFPAAGLSFEADECVQRACETIYRTRFPYDVVFNAWARQILKNAIRHRFYQAETQGYYLLDDLFNTPSQHDPQSTDHQEWEIPDPDRTLESWELHDLVHDLISQLPSKSQQEVMRLTCFSDLDDTEIATRLNKSIQAVHNLRNRARNTMRCLLEPYMDLLIQL